MFAGDLFTQYRCIDVGLQFHGRPNTQPQPLSTGLAPRIFFIFPPFPRDGGRKRSEGRGTLSLSKIRGNRGEKGGREGGVDAGKGRGHVFWGGGVLNIYFEG